MAGPLACLLLVCSPCLGNERRKAMQKQSIDFSAGGQKMSGGRY